MTTEATSDATQPVMAPPPDPLSSDRDPSPTEVCPRLSETAVGRR